MPQLYHLYKGVFMVNALSLDFRPPLPPSMVVLEICLLCELTSTFTDKMVRLSLNLCPHTKDRAVQYSDQAWGGAKLYTCILKSPMSGKIFLIICILSVSLKHLIMVMNDLEIC